MPKTDILLIQTQAEHAGAQEIARILADYLTTQGFSVRQIFLYRKTKTFEKQEGIYFCADARPQTFKALLALLHNLKCYIQKYSPDHVITFQHYGNIIGGLAAHYCGVKTIIANQLSSPQIISWPVRWIDGILGSIGIYSAIVVNSHNTFKEYARWPKWYTRHLARIDHGFANKTASLDRATARQQLGLPQNLTILGSVARLHALKRLDTAIRLLPYHESWHFALAGQGPEETALKCLAHTLGVANRVHFLGEKNPEDIGIVLAALDIFVFPSQAETFGLAAVEAAQAGIPVVAYDLPVLREVLRGTGGEACAEFIPDHSCESWGSCITHLLSSPQERERLRQSGKTLQQKYSLETMAKAYLHLLHNHTRASVSGL